MVVECDRFPMIRLMILRALLLLAVSALAEAQPVEKTFKLPFKIAGVGWMDLRVSTAGALPAEDRKVRIEVAGILVSPSKEEPKRANLLWTFGFTNKGMKAVESVRVEEVSPTEVAITRVDDASPEFKDGYWIGNSVPTEATRDTQPWLYAEGPSNFVFRFSVKEPGKEPRVLYQVAAFSQEAKEYFRAQIKKINEG